MVDVGAKNSQLYIFLGLINRLDHEALIVGQEEEAAALAWPLTCLEHLLAVQLRGETVLKHLQADLISIEKLSKLVQLMISDFSHRVNQSLIIGYILLIQVIRQ